MDEYDFEGNIIKLLELIKNSIENKTIPEKSDWLVKLFEEFGISSPWKLDVKPALEKIDQFITDIKDWEYQLRDAKECAEDVYGILDEYRVGYDNISEEELRKAKDRYEDRVDSLGYWISYNYRDEYYFDFGE